MLLVLAVVIYLAWIYQLMGERSVVRFGSLAFIRNIRMSAYCFGDRGIRRSGYENICVSPVCPDVLVCFAFVVCGCALRHCTKPDIGCRLLHA